MSDVTLLAGLFTGSASTLGQVFLATQPEMALHEKVEIPLIVGSKEDAAGFGRLERYGYKGAAEVCDPRDYVTPKAFGEALLKLFKQYKIDWFGQYGWLPWTPENVIEEFPGTNQHPELPKFFGGEGWHSLTPHAGAFDFAQLTRHKIAYPVAQLVHPEYDKGELLAFTPVHINSDCTSPEALQKQVLPFEWLTQIEALLHIADAHGEVPRLLDCPVSLTPGEALILGKVRQKTLEKFPNGKRKE